MYSSGDERVWVDARINVPYVSNTATPSITYLPARYVRLFSCGPSHHEICVHYSAYMWTWQMRGRVMTPAGSRSCGTGFLWIQTWGAGFGSVQEGGVCVVATRALKYLWWAGRVSLLSPASSSGGDDAAPVDDIRHSARDVQLIGFKRPQNWC